MRYPRLLSKFFGYALILVPILVGGGVLYDLDARYLPYRPAAVADP